VPSAQEVSSPSVSPSVGGTRTSLGQLRQIAESADSVSEINTLIQQARQQFDLLANREALQFVGRLQKAKQELKEMRGVSVDASLDGFNRTLREAVRSANSLGTRLANAVTGFADQLSQGIGQSVGDALFADQGRLNRLRGRRRQIQQNLRQARRSGNFQQVSQLSNELDRVNQKLRQSRTLAGRLGQAFQNFGQIAKQALESFVSQVVQAIAKIAALKLISSFLGGGGGFGAVIGSTIGGGGVNPLSGIGGAVGQTQSVNITGQVIRQGTTTKTVYDTTTRQQEQKHPTYRG